MLHGRPCPREAYQAEWRCCEARSSWPRHSRNILCSNICWHSLLWLQHVGATFSHCGLESTTSVMPNQQPLLWSTVFLATLESIWAPVCLLVSVEPSHTCLPYLSSNGATMHCGTVQGPSLPPDHMPFAFRAQCFPEGPGRVAEYLHTLSATESTTELYPQEFKCIWRLLEIGTTFPESHLPL